jgi:hypothetical protein
MNLWRSGHRRLTVRGRREPHKHEGEAAHEVPQIMIPKPAQVQPRKILVEAA